MDTGLSNIAIFSTIGLLAAGWSQVKGVVDRFRALFVTRIIISSESMMEAVHYYLSENFKRFPVGSRKFNSRSLFVRPVGRVQEVAIELPAPQPIIYFRGLVPLWLGCLPDPHNPSLGNGAGGELTVIRGTIDPEKLLKDALDSFNNSKRSGDGGKRYRVVRVSGTAGDAAGFNQRGGDSRGDLAVFAENTTISMMARYLGWTRDEIGAPLPDNPMGALMLPPELEDARTEFRRWLQSEEWFKTRRVPWRRGWLLTSDPGCGKSSFLRALAQESDIPVFSFDLATLTNKELDARWRDMQESVPCIALFEDIDAVFHGRQNILCKERGVTFDCLLNLMSGVESADGVFVTVTTNDISKLDPALGIEFEEGVSSRPGRLDRVVVVPRMAEEARRRLAGSILRDCTEHVEDLVLRSEGYTAAQTTEICVSVAQKHFWETTVTK